MRKRLLIFCLVIILVACLCGCVSDSNTAVVSKPTKESNFSITFIDVGQGDAALVECDGRFMLIDGGNTTAGDIVYNALVEKGVQHLDILAISHMHQDHIGGLTRALEYATKIDKTISNSDRGESNAFKDLKHELGINGAHISVACTGDKYQLGSAAVEVVDSSAEDENDSLVLLITYGDTKFLFTGDIEEKAQKRISEKYENDKDEAYKINLIKMPHHGADPDADSNVKPENSSLYRFLRTFMPDYAVISVGENNGYGHPDSDTLSKLNNLGAKVYRTDKNGNITVKSDGKEISVETSR